MRSRNIKIMRWLLIVVVITVVALFAYVWQPAIDPVQATTEIYPQEQIKLGKDVASAGACIVCHTANDQTPYTGGLPMETPFGTIYSTNITPDVETGIGAWSFEAFDRSMRKGVARDGHYLYPAFPYTHFTHLNQEEMQALYAYMMSLEPVEEHPPKTDLPFPFNMRPLMAGWNLLYLEKGPVKVVEDESKLWNRGHYLVNSSGHCAACHSPRNSLGAEKKGDDYLAGGEAEGWIAPALNQDSPAPIQWTEDALYDYLRYGFALEHGSAGGSMAPVVREGTSQLPEDDVRAIATYLASFHSTNTTESTQEVVNNRTKETDRSLKTLTPPQTQGARMFNSACMSCHHAGDGPTLFGVRPELWLSSTLYLDKPDNLIHFVLDGVQNPAHPDLGYMAPFRHSLSDEQIATLVNYMRTSFAQKEAWPDLEGTVARIREKTRYSPSKDKWTSTTDN